VKPFEYHRATDVAGAVAMVAANPGARYLAGGTNLVDLMKLGVERPDLLVDVTDLPLHGITDTTDGGVHIGSQVSNSDVAADRRIRERYPALAQAILAGASGQLRNVATTGGNLMQRTRCMYFTDVTQPCNKRSPGTGCGARSGEHHNLAVLGASQHCIATHPSDMAVALAAIGAEVHVTGPAGERTIPIPGLHRLPGDEPWNDTVLERGELITAVDLEPLAPGLAAHSTYRKVRDRASFSFAVVSVAAALDVADGTVRDCRIALGAVAHGPWRAWRAEEELRGGPATPERFAAAAEAELAQARPLRDNAFKVPLARNLLTATLSELGEEAA
jgi:xanthine dehydrogenase YagS FAD-binding subunit